MFTSDGMLDTQIAHRVAAANSAFARLHQDKSLVIKSRILVHQASVPSDHCHYSLLHGSETWSLLDKHLNQLSVFHICMRCLRQICGISLLAHITDHVILKQCEAFSADLCFV